MKTITSFLLSCIVLVGCAFTTAAQSIRVGVIVDHCAPGEQAALQKMLSGSKELSFQMVKASGLQKAGALQRFTHVWYHRTDTTAFEAAELALGPLLRQYVQGGGHLFLSMESVPLLNRWGIEKTPFELRADSIRDDGFGRPLGFHAFKDHPIFTGLLGGVYTSKLKQDHVVRKHGFFEGTTPASAKVIGIQWTYITFSENNKLLLEYQLGKGKIIAAGSYLYYDADNYNAQHLKKFTENVFRYTANLFPAGRKYYWDYAEKSITPHSFTVGPVKPVAATSWKLPAPTLSLRQDSATRDFYDLVGRKILWMGKLNGGVDEIWMHPYMALRDLAAGVKVKGEDSITWLHRLPASVTLAPEYLVRTYKVKNTVIKEICTVSFEDPAGIVHYEIEGNDLEELSLRYASNLRFMWPYAHTATGHIQYGYNKAINGHLISGQGGELNTVVTYSSLPVRQSAVVDKALNGVRIQADFPVTNKAVLNAYITGSTRSYRDAVKLFASGQQQMSRLFEKSNQYYRSLLDNHLRFDTPDTLFNKGYQWALARTDQFLQTTPGIGTALMAGFGTTARGWNGRHTISGRPGYAWYFGRDGEWSAMAINAYGDFAMVKEMLEALIRYQDINGKIYHELTSSGVAHYDASDATPLFVVLAAHYLKYSGDLAYIRSRWPAIKKAMDFCYTTDTDGDGLIENTNVGHGWIEGGSLFGTHTEFYLAGCWASALEGAGYMAAYLNEENLAATYKRDAENVKATIDKDFWNEGEQFFHNGKMRDGSYMPDATVLATVPIYLKAVTDNTKSQRVNDRLASHRFSTDWGIRMIEDNSRRYKAGSYHAGMVWPLYGGWAALSEFTTGNNRSGYQHIMNNLLVYRHWGLGSVEETLNGDQYKPNGVCSHQCWSETMVLQPAIEGMLGLEPDAMRKTLTLAPYFPWNWKKTSVKNIRMGAALIDLQLQREAGRTIYTFTANQPVQLVFRPKFPFGTVAGKVAVNGKPLDVQTAPNAEGVELHTSFTLQKGTTVLSVEYSGGIGALPIVALPAPGDSSVSARIVDEELKDGVYSLTIEGRPGSTHNIRIFAVQQPSAVDGAQWKKDGDNLLTLQVELPRSEKDKYVSKEIRIRY